MKILKGIMKILDKPLAASRKAWWKHWWGNVAMQNHLFSRKTDTRKNIGMKLFALPDGDDKSDEGPKIKMGILSLLMLPKQAQPKFLVCLNHNFPKQSPGLTVPCKSAVKQPHHPSTTSFQRTFLL